MLVLTAPDCGFLAAAAAVACVPPSDMAADDADMVVSGDNGQEEERGFRGMPSLGATLPRPGDWRVGM